LGSGSGSGFGSDCTQGVDSDRGGRAGKVSSDAPDFLVVLIGGVSADELVVFEDDDNIRT
jgi:hypothetical protein